MQKEVKTDSPEATEEFGRRLGARLQGGEVIELVGDVGAGKTTLVRGLVAGLGSGDHVSSPTFTVCNTYNGKFIIHHCDFYRLHDDALIKKELAELISEDSIVLLEWADEVVRVLPKDHIRVAITTNGEDGRTFAISLPERYNYISL